MASIISAGTTSGTALNMSGDTTGILQLATNGTTTAMTIDTSQNVGIGATPNSKLYVRAATNANLRVTDASGTLNLSAENDAGSAQVTMKFNGSQMMLDASGNLLVGGTTVYGSCKTTIDSGSGNTLAIRLTNTGSSYTLFYYNSTITGSIGTNGTTTSYNTSSDYRLKENIAPMTGALAKVAQLKPVTYKWKTNGSDGQGFIAHELQAVVPDCVTGEKDATREEEYEVTPAVKDEQGNITTSAVMGTRTVPSYQGIDTSFLVATLTAAIQELKAINDTQAETINALTARIEALENR